MPVASELTLTHNRIGFVLQPNKIKHWISYEMRFIVEFLTLAIFLSFLIWCLFVVNAGMSIFCWIFSFLLFSSPLLIIIIICVQMEYTIECRWTLDKTHKKSNTEAKTTQCKRKIEKKNCSLYVSNLVEYSTLNAEWNSLCIVFIGAKKTFISPDQHISLLISLLFTYQCNRNATACCFCSILTQSAILLDKMKRCVFYDAFSCQQLNNIINCRNQ